MILLSLPIAQPRNKMVADFLSKSKPLQESLFRLHHNTIMGLAPRMVDQYRMQYIKVKANKAALVESYLSK